MIKKTLMITLIAAPFQLYPMTNIKESLKKLFSLPTVRRSLSLDNVSQISAPSEHIDTHKLIPQKLRRNNAFISKTIKPYPTNTIPTITIYLVPQKLEKSKPCKRCSKEFLYVKRTKKSDPL